MKTKTLNNNPNSMALIMENFQKFIEEVDTEEIDNTVYLFENKRIKTCQFETLLEKVDNKLLTFEEISKIWEKSILYELKQIEKLDEGILQWTKEKIASLGKGGFEKWVAAVTKLGRQAVGVFVKLFKQGIALVSRFLKQIKSPEFGAKVYFGAMGGIRKVMKAAKTVLRFMGPVVIVLCIVLALSLAVPATAHAAAAQTGMESQILEIAIEICTEAIDLMGAVEQIEPETVSDFQSRTMVDGEVIQMVNDVAFEKSESVANQHVRAIEVLLDALHERFVRDGETMTLNDFMEVKHGLDNETKEIITLAIENAREMQESDPQMAEQYAELGKSVEVLWSGHVESVIEDISHTWGRTIGGETSSGASELTRSIGHQTGVNVPTRGINEQKT